MARGEEINHLLVFERDGWVCHLCSEPIDRRLRGDAWMRATVDHVVDLSRGGSHTYDNTRAAHWLCNMEKAGNLPKLVRSSRHGTL